ncbi:MAG: hypothetical protein Kow00105_10290 [Phycisphaeraceae bacterium]
MVCVLIDPQTPVNVDNNPPGSWRLNDEHRLGVYRIYTGLAIVPGPGNRPNSDPG